MEIQQPDTTYHNPPNLVIMGELGSAFRGSGNPESTSADINAVAPNNRTVPSISVSIVDYDTYSNQLGLQTNESDSDAQYSPWNSVGAASLDSLFVPYTNALQSRFLPHFESPTSSNTGRSDTLDPYNPLKLLAVAGKSHATDEWLDKGHNIGMALSDNPNDSQMQDLYPGDRDDAPVDFNFERDFFARSKAETSGIRAVGFRAPMILSGWGYDTDGNPVPASGSVIHPEATWNPQVWKTGPVDLRWDDARKVWTGGGTGGGGDTTYYLCKVTNTYNPPNFSFEVDRSRTRDQYTRNAPTALRTFDSSEAIYDPEYVAYYSDPNNVGQYESLDYDGIEYPFYEAFIIRNTSTTVNSQSYYNIWTEDCSDCGPIQNACYGSGTAGAHAGSSTDRKVLIENPLRQSLDTGDLCFTINTGRTKTINSGAWTGGSGTLAAANMVIHTDGSGEIDVLTAGSNYTHGGFAIQSGCNLGVCGDITLYFGGAGNGLLSGIVDPEKGHKATGTCPLQIIPANATAGTESLPIHWMLQSEFKSQQVVTHAECSAGVLQTCTMKIQTQGFKTCEYCGEDTAFINAY